MKEQDLFYLLNAISAVTGIPVRVYQRRVRIHFFTLLPFPEDPILPLEKQVFSREEKLGYFFTDDLYYYVYLKTEDAKTIILGPSGFRKQNPQERMDAAFYKGLDEEKTQAYYQSLTHLASYPLATLIWIMLMLNLVLNGERITLSKYLDSLSEPLPEEEKKKNATETEEIFDCSRMKRERKLLSYVSHGDREGLDDYLKNLCALRPRKPSDISLRERKNRFIAFATLTSRAAIQGGMDPEEALSLSDFYIRYAEAMARAEEISSLTARMLKDYTQRVEKLQIQGYSDLVKQVYRYVRKHISESIPVDDVAKDVSLSHGRLSVRFKKESGRTVSRFIKEVKMEEAKELLAGTDQTLSRISTYLGFFSLNYFCTLFTKIVGETPVSYRKKNRKQRMSGLLLSTEEDCG